jgi:hypothetical protein
VRGNTGKPDVPSIANLRLDPFKSMVNRMKELPG